MTLRVLGIGSWYADDQPDDALAGCHLRWPTRGARYLDGWVVVAVKRWSR